MRATEISCNKQRKKTNPHWCSGNISVSHTGATGSIPVWGFLYFFVRLLYELVPSMESAATRILLHDEEKKSQGKKHTQRSPLLSLNKVERTYCFHSDCACDMHRARFARRNCPNCTITIFCSFGMAAIRVHIERAEAIKHTTIFATCERNFNLSRFSNCGAETN
jgi:hypothetical protein